MILNDSSVNMTYHIVRRFLGNVFLRMSLFHNRLHILGICHLRLYIKPLFLPQHLLLVPPRLVVLKNKSMSFISSGKIFIV